MNFENVTLAISDLGSCGDRFPKYVPTYYIMIHRCVGYLVCFESYPSIQIFHQCNETQNNGHLWDHIKASSIHRCPLYVGFRQKGFLWYVVLPLLLILAF